MASYFGEITSLPSRAVYDEFEEKPVPEVILETNSRIVKPYNFAVFAVGKISSCFVACNFRSDNSQLIASVRMVSANVTCDNFSGLDYRKKPKIIARAYANPGSPEFMFCEVDDDVTEELSYTLCEQLLSLCSSDVKCITLMSTHISNYKTDAPDADVCSILRCLLTSKYREKYPLVCVPYLTPPNIITNFPAAVLTEFEIRELPAALFILYTDMLSVDSKSIAQFNEVLNIPIIEQLPKNLDAESKLKIYLKINSPVEGNLYL